ncbi:hypothetical protein Pelo_748 [Pelomyxa schiedti]|nr:hypothetical protein Pelo_748 [Pelomyxa schiedti]
MTSTTGGGTGGGDVTSYGGDIKLATDRIANWIRKNSAAVMSIEGLRADVDRIGAKVLASEGVTSGHRDQVVQLQATMQSCSRDWKATRDDLASVRNELQLLQRVDVGRIVEEKVLHEREEIMKEVKALLHADKLEVKRARLEESKTMWDEINLKISSEVLGLSLKMKQDREEDMHEIDSKLQALAYKLTNHHQTEFKAMEESFTKLKDFISKARETDTTTILDSVFAHVSTMQTDIMSTISADHNTLSKDLEQIRFECNKQVSTESLKLLHTIQTLLDQSTSQMQDNFSKKVQELRSDTISIHQDISSIQSKLVEQETEMQNLNETNRQWVSHQLEHLTDAVSVAGELLVGYPKEKTHQEIQEWLSSIGFAKYSDKFLQNGFTSLQSVKEITDTDLINIGISLVGHRKAILSSLGTLLTPEDTNMRQLQEREQQQRDRELQRKRILDEHHAALVKFDQQQRDEEMRLEQERMTRKQLQAQQLQEETRLRLELEEEEKAHKLLEEQRAKAREAQKKQLEQEKIQRERTRKEEIRQQVISDPSVKELISLSLSLDSTPIITPVVTRKPERKLSEDVSPAKPSSGTSTPTSDTPSSSIRTQPQPSNNLDDIHSRQQNLDDSYAREMAEIEQQQRSIREAARAREKEREQQRIQMEKENQEKEARFKQERERERERERQERDVKERERLQQQQQKQQQDLKEREQALARAKEELERKRAEQERRIREREQLQKQHQMQLLQQQQQQARNAQVAAQAEAQAQAAKIKVEAEAQAAAKLRVEAEAQAAAKLKAEAEAQAAMKLKAEAEAQAAAKLKAEAEAEQAKSKSRQLPQPHPKKPATETAPAKPSADTENPDTAGSTEKLPEDDKANVEDTEPIKEEAPKPRKPFVQYPTPKSFAPRGGGGGGGRGAIQFSEEVDSTLTQVRDDTSDTDWMVVGYGSSKTQIELYGSGSGGFDEFIECISSHSEDVIYGYLRLTHHKQQRTKFVRITHMPDTLTGFVRAKANTDKPVIEGLFGSTCHAFWNISRASEVTLEAIEGKVWNYDLANKQQKQNAKHPPKPAEAERPAAKPAPPAKPIATKAKAAQPPPPPPEDEEIPPPIDEEVPPKPVKQEAPANPAPAKKAPARMNKSGEPTTTTTTTTSYSTPAPAPVQPMTAASIMGGDLWEDTPLFEPVVAKPTPTKPTAKASTAQSQPRKDTPTPASTSATKRTEINLEEKVAKFKSVISTNGEKEADNTVILFGSLCESLTGESRDVISTVLRTMRQKNIVDYPTPLEDDSVITLLSS